MRVDDDIFPRTDGQHTANAGGFCPSVRDHHQPHTHTHTHIHTAHVAPRAGRTDRAQLGSGDEAAIAADNYLARSNFVEILNQARHAFAFALAFPHLGTPRIRIRIPAAKTSKTSRTSKI